MKNDDVKREIEHMMENRKHHSNTNNLIDFPKIQAGADIHAGDGGYSIGTKEKYDEFVKIRNQSMKSMNGKIKELMIEAGYAYPEGATRAHKLAELIVKECFEVLKPVKCQRTECGQRNVELLQEHFGVEE